MKVIVKQVSSTTHKRLQEKTIEIPKIMFQNIIQTGHLEINDIEHNVIETATKQYLSDKYSKFDGGIIVDDKAGPILTQEEATEFEEKNPEPLEIVIGSNLHHISKMCNILFSKGYLPAGSPTQIETPNGKRIAQTMYKL